MIRIESSTFGLSSGSRKTRIETGQDENGYGWTIKGLSSGSRKTRIETIAPAFALLYQARLSSGSRKTRIETCYWLAVGFYLSQV